MMLLVVTSRCRPPEGCICVQLRSRARLRREAFANRVTNRKRFARVRRLTAARRPLPLWPARGLCRPRARMSGGVRYCRNSVRCGSPERSVVSASGATPRAFRRKLTFSQARRPVYFANETRADTKSTQPEVRPTPADRTGLSSLTNRRDNRQHSLRGCAALQAKVCCYPVVVGPRTRESVRLADRARRTGLSDPSRTSPFGEPEVRLGPQKLEVFLHTPNRIRCPSPCHRNDRVCQCFSSFGGRRARYGATQHITVVLTAACPVSRAESASCELATAVTEVAAG